MARVDPAGTGPSATGPAVGRSGSPRHSSSAGLRARRTPGAVRTAAAGHPSLALVCGGAGVGKTRLVAEVAGLARLEAQWWQCPVFRNIGRLALAPVADWVRNPAVQSATATLDPPGAPRSTGWCRPARGQRGAGSGQWSTPGNAIASSRASRGRCWRRPSDATGSGQYAMVATGDLAFLTFCLGLSASAQILVAGTLRDDNLDDDPELAGWTVRMRATDCSPSLSSARWRSRYSTSGCGDLRAAASGSRHEPAPGDDGGFPLYVIEAVRSSVDLGSRRCRSMISPRCCATVWSRRPRLPGRCRPRPRWGRTSPSICSLRRATSTRHVVGQSTSCGGADHARVP